MTAKTPVFVSDSEIVSEQNGHKTHRFFNVNGDDMIPASSLRGSIRSVFEAATNSTFGVFEGEKPLYYRAYPSWGNDMKPGIIEEGKQGFVVRLLQAAKIPLQKFDALVPRSCRDGQQPCWAVIGKSKKGLAPVVAMSEDGKGLKGNKVKGYVYRTGRNIDTKRNERFFYESGGSQTLPIAQDVAQSYEDSIADYHNRRSSIQSSIEAQDGLEISTFISDENWRLRPGCLIYVKVKNNAVVGLYPIAIPRLAYENSRRKLVGRLNLHKHLLPPTDINKLCLASRVFGWVSQEKPQTEEEQRKNLEKEVAYRGRVRFSNATTHALRNDNPLTLSILGTPHPTSLEFYLDDVQHIKARRDGQHGYNEPRAKIRGRKIYRHHKSFEKNEAMVGEDKKSDQNRTVQGVYEPDSVWTFTIEFENLQPVELGALLWTLELREGDRQGYHRIGYGKPLGFGSVQIEVTGLDFYDAKTRYAADKRVEFTDDEKKKQQQENVRSYKPKLVNRFQKTISRLYGNTPFDKLDNIVDLLALLSERDDSLPIHYPRLDRDRQADNNEGFRWFMTNRDGQQVRLSSADEDEGLPYDVANNN